MLFITHLIVNERKCNQQLLSTIYMESRTLLSPGEAATVSAQDIFVPSPTGKGKKGMRVDLKI
jgi:hypothetical protein